jgi:hypothetical protein
MSNETKIPNNRVVGVISGSRSAEDAVTRLRSEGFDDVLVMSHVDTAGEGVNPISALMGMLADHLSDETAYFGPVPGGHQERQPCRGGACQRRAD